MKKVNVPILTYHSIDSSGSVISTRPEKFRAQMQHLRDASFQVIPLRELVKRLRHNEPLPASAVVITFDDGIRNVYEAAYPVLREFGFPATVFLVAGRCGSNNQWPGQPDWTPTWDLLGWDEIAEMAQHGFEFGAHSLNHPDLSKLSIEQATEEIIGSKSWIQERLGREVLVFAYPYGRQTPQVRQVVQQHFAGACSTELSVVEPTSDCHWLPRIEMYYFSRNDLFDLLGTVHFYHYIAWRRGLRAVRRLYLTWRQCLFSGWP